MTMDDGNSVYVGGLPYDITDEALRRVFSPYGTVLNIKIVNDQSVRGKCYGFVTFSNHRSADDAIQGMDGKRIGGRAVRVNEVTTRFGGRVNPGAQGRFQPQSPGGRSGFSCERDRYRERDRSQDRRMDHYADKERVYEHSHGFERGCDHDVVDRNGYKERVFGGDQGGDWRGDNGRGVNGSCDHQGRSQETKREDSVEITFFLILLCTAWTLAGTNFLFVKEEIEALTETRDVLHDEVLVMEGRLRAKEDMCADLQKKFEILEDLLNDEKKRTSQRRKELAKLHKSFSRVRECTDNLKDCEQELQSLVNSVAREGLVGADEGLENGYA
ncbi:hypothetical protein Bca4012_025761 [Brassica carinata]